MWIGESLRNTGVEEVNNQRRWPHGLWNLAHNDTLSIWAGQHAGEVAKRIHGKNTLELTYDESHAQRHLLEFQKENVAWRECPWFADLHWEERFLIWEWMRSEGHRGTILSPQTHLIGIGTNISQLREKILLVLVMRVA